MHSNLIIDTRTPTTSDCGNTSVGTYRRRYQDGGDDPIAKSRPNSYNMYETGWFEQKGPWNFRPPLHGGGTGTASSCGFVPLILFTGLTSGEELEMFTRLVSKVRGTTFSTSLLLAEARESISMVNSSAKTLALAVTQAKRGKLRASWNTLTNGLGFPPKGSARQFVDGVSSGWLAYQYGWKPLVSDMAAAANHIVSTPIRAKDFVITTARVKPGSLMGGPGFTPNGYAESVYRFACHVRQTNFSSSMPTMWDVSRVAWEKLPYSFVLDWFLPLGTYLEARAYQERIDGTYVRTLYHKGRATLGQSIYYTTNMSAGYYTVNMQRIVGSYSPPLPTLKLDLKPAQVLSGLSLLWQAVRR